MFAEFSAGEAEGSDELKEVLEAAVALCDHLEANVCGDAVVRDCVVCVLVGTAQSDPLQALLNSLSVLLLSRDIERAIVKCSALVKPTMPAKSQIGGASGAAVLT